MEGSIKKNPSSTSLSSTVTDSMIHTMVFRKHSYHRKDKSLALLCINFLDIYNRDDVKVVGLDDVKVVGLGDASKRLGVERRRIYDIVNILEIVGIVARKGKDEYYFIGFDGIPKALCRLKDKAFTGSRFSYLVSINAKVGESLMLQQASEDSEDTMLDIDSVGWKDKSSTCSSHLQLGSSKLDNKRESSLGLLTENFVQLFLSAPDELILLDEAAKTLLGDTPNESNIRTKIRRLYDIANVLSSINLIEKTRDFMSRKPAFRWLGINERLHLCSKKRVLGTDITNTIHKRNMITSSTKDESNQKVKMETNIQIKFQDLTDEIGHEKMPKLVESSKDIVFGPFAPVNLCTTSTTKKNNVKLEDLESLAHTCRPQYQNEVLKDLFGHYTEALKTWYLEVCEKQ